MAASDTHLQREGSAGGAKGVEMQVGMQLGSDCEQDKGAYAQQKIAHGGV